MHPFIVAILPRPQVDLLHPLTTLEWEQCCKVPDNLTGAQAVVLGDMVYVGEQTANMGPGSLLIYDVTRDSWIKRINTPTNLYTLTTYGSELVLVGGRYPCTELFEMLRPSNVTNKVWVLDEHQCLNSNRLPAMLTAHMRASAVSKDNHLVVAGGTDGLSYSMFSMMPAVDVVEVYDGNVWARAQSLPRIDRTWKSIPCEGKWYLYGRIRSCYTSLDSLIATARSDTPATEEQTSVWVDLPDGPQPVLYAPTMFGTQLVDVRGYTCSLSHRSTSALHVFCHGHGQQSSQWMHVEDLPVACHSTCMLLLPTRELLVVVLEAETGNRDPRSIFKGRVRGEWHCSVSFPQNRVTV